MNFICKCNGYGIQRLSDDSWLALEMVIDDCRKQFLAWLDSDSKLASQYLPGTRFNSNRDVGSRIAHATTDAEFQTSPVPWVLDALRDCAGADYWYTYEKQWD
jgi:hypothetical protein